MGRTKRNIVANALGKGWSFISVYLFVPFYLEFLGVEAYGIVGFFAILQGVFAFADVGLTATMSREMARLSAQSGSEGEIRDLVRTIESLYLGIAATIAVLVAIAADFIADYWLNSQNVPRDTVTGAVRLMGLAMALQFPAGMYQGGLMGLERQVASNGIQVAWGVLRSVGAVLILALVAPTLQAFFLWHVLANLTYCLAVRQTLWSVLPGARSAGKKPQFRWAVFQRIWPYAAGMTGITLISTALTQADKLVVSRMLSLESLAYYALAGTLSQVPMLLTVPIANAVFPRLASLVAVDRSEQVCQLYHKASHLISAVVLPVGLVVMCFSHEILATWTRSPVVAKQAWLAAAILVAGSVCQALLVMSYNLALAHGWTRLSLTMGVVCLAGLIPALILLVPAYGVVGSATSWFLLNLLLMPPWIYLVHRRCLPGEVGRWCRRDVGLPLAAALPCVLIGRWLVPAGFSGMPAIVAVGAVTAVAMSASLLTLPDLTRLLRRPATSLGGSTVQPTIPSE